MVNRIEEGPVELQKIEELKLQLKTLKEDTNNIVHVVEQAAYYESERLGRKLSPEEKKKLFDDVADKLEKDIATITDKLNNLDPNWNSTQK